MILTSWRAAVVCVLPQVDPLLLSLFDVLGVVRDHHSAVCFVTEPHDGEVERYRDVREHPVVEQVRSDKNVPSS